MPKLFEITIKAYKTFYIEADSQDDAYEQSVVQDESNTSHSGDYEWEHDETDAKELSEQEAEYTRKRYPKLIAKSDEEENHENTKSKS